MQLVKELYGRVSGLFGSSTARTLSSSTNKGSSMTNHSNVRPMFEVYEVPDEDKTPRSIYVLVKMSDRKNKRQPFVTKEVKDPRPQYDCYFPSGHCIRIVGSDELERLGMHEGAGLVDMATGEVVSDEPPPSLREMSIRKTKPPRRNAA